MTTLVLTGAGISTESGIPDFRSPGGVWDRFDPDEFTIRRFHTDPAAFWDRRAALVAAMDYLDAEPNEAHRLLAEACLDGRVDHVITQNVDGLHAQAGTPPDKLLEVHGNGRRTICMTCRGREDVRKTLARRVTGEAPMCTECGGVMKPDVVLFGEPVEAMPAAEALVVEADTLIVVGSSLHVHPVAGLAGLAASTGARLIILNRDPTPYDAIAHDVDHRPVSESLGSFLQ